MGIAQQTQAATSTSKGQTPQSCSWEKVDAKRGLLGDGNPKINESDARIIWGKNFNGVPNLLVSDAIAMLARATGRGKSGVEQAVDIAALPKMIEKFPFAARIALENKSRSGTLNESEIKLIHDNLKKNGCLGPSK